MGERERERERRERGGRERERERLIEREREREGETYTGGECIEKRYAFFFYKTQYPVHWTTESALHFTASPGRPEGSFSYRLDFSGKHSAMLQLLYEGYSLTLPPLSITRYSFIQLSEQGRRGENENSQTSKQLQSED